MPKRRQTKTITSIDIEPYLVLFRYILSLLGFNNFLELKNFIKSNVLDVIPTAEITSNNHSNTYFALALSDKLSTTPIPLFSISITEEDLLKYDSRIINYLNKINSKREKPINLKYFQYLAVLFTEIYLDLLKNKPYDFINSLNEFASLNSLPFTFPVDEPNKLNQLAYYMATGSGKTIIAHINYYQFFEYNLFQPDNILFITPNTILSQHHYENLIKSGIEATLYSESDSHSLSPNNVLIIEITKFIEKKETAGSRISPDTFEGRNLIFVDEGHKGQSSEEKKWKSYRDQLSKNGFVFEYSATFAQILDHKKEPDIFDEYCKSIIFDYSYKYFYLDGYGKDFSILNVNPPKNFPERLYTEYIFVGNLLTFYEQLLIFSKNQQLIRKYNLEKPLWIFIGLTVTAERKELPDVLTIVTLIDKFLSNQKWALSVIDDIFNARTGLRNPFGEDLFENAFNFLNLAYHSTHNKLDFYNNLIQTVFNGPGPLRLFEIKNAEGEIALKTGDNPYFGLINIGKKDEFKKLLSKSGFSINQDLVSNSIFDSIKSKDSTINILIGSKKFIEGWDTWRITSIGLLYIGKSQGPQIIQLFGRGVRLLGENNSLKRSNNPDIKPLETLKICAIKSDYLFKFLEKIRKEGIEIEPISIPIYPNHEDKWNDLKIVKVNPSNFYKQEFIDLSKNAKLPRPTILNLLPKTQIATSTSIRDSITLETMLSSPQYDIYLINLSPYINIFNWQRIYSEILSFKLENNYWNIHFTVDSLKNILANGATSSNDPNPYYKLYAPPEIKNITSYENLLRLENIAISILKKHISSIYKFSLREHESQNVNLVNIDDIQPLSIFKSNGTYTQTIYVKKDPTLLNHIRHIQEIISNPKYLFQNDPDNPYLPRIIFDRSLFLPLIIYARNLNHIEFMNPTGLNEGERDFLMELMNYLKKPDINLSPYEIFIYRNFPKSGIGFLLESSEKFYPDFIIWIKTQSNTFPQAIVFADPKSGYFPFQEKLDLSISIKNIQSEISNRYKVKIILESFIIITNPNICPDPSKNLINLSQINLIFKKIIDQF